MSQIIEQPRYLCPLAAQQTVLGIPRASPIIHAGPGCAAKVHEGLDFYAGYQGEGYCGGSHIASTNASSTEVVFGGEPKLRKIIDGTLKVIDADLFVVLTGCTSDIIGDDTESVVSEFQEEGKPVVWVETGGFKGNNYRGHELVVKAIIDQYVGVRTPHVKNGLVNVFSVVPYQNPYWRGDLDEIKRLLERLGLQVNILFGTSSQGVSEWKEIPDAQFNLLVSAWNGLSIVRHLQKKYGTPFLHYPVLPVGAAETENFLRAVSRFAGLDIERTEAVIAEEKKKYYIYFCDTADFLTSNQNSHPNTFYTIGDANYTLGISSFLIKELGLTPKTQFVIDNPDISFQEPISQAFQTIDPEVPVDVRIENDSGKIKERITSIENEPNDTIFLASSFDKDIADKIRAYILYISWPIHHRLIVNKSYVGFQGGLTLLEDIYTKVLERSKP